MRANGSEHFRSGGLASQPCSVAEPQLLPPSGMPRRPGIVQVADDKDPGGCLTKAVKLYDSFFDNKSQIYFISTLTYVRFLTFPCFFPLPYLTFTHGAVFQTWV